MDLEYLRDAAMYGAVFGFFAMVWFGWAQENPPKKLVPYLIAGSILSGILLAVGTAIAALNWNTGSVLGDEAAMMQYGITVGVEFAIAGIGVGILYALKRGEYAASWVALIVGIHFISLASVFQDRLLYILAGVFLVAVGAAIFVARRKKVAISAVNGVLCGGILLFVAALGLVRALFML